MKSDPVITILKTSAAIIAAAGTLTASLGLLAGTVSLPLALVSLSTFALMNLVFLLGD